MVAPYFCLTWAAGKLSKVHMPSSASAGAAMETSRVASSTFRRIGFSFCSGAQLCQPGGHDPSGPRVHRLPDDAGRFQESARVRGEAIDEKPVLVVGKKERHEIFAPVALLVLGIGQDLFRRIVPNLHDRGRQTFRRR